MRNSCHHDMKVIQGGGKFCTKCLFEQPSKMKKVHDYAEKLGRKQDVDRASRRVKGVRTLAKISMLESGSVA